MDEQTLLAAIRTLTTFLVVCVLIWGVGLTAVVTTLWATVRRLRAIEVALQTCQANCQPMLRALSIDIAKLSEWRRLVEREPTPSA